MNESAAAKRTRRLAEGRRQTSELKRAEALEACARLATLAAPITFASVANAANVSTWLLYNVPALRDAVVAAQREQRRRRRTSTPLVDEGPSDASLRTDLALARSELTALRQLNGQLNRRLELRLGVEVEGATNHELLDRIRELEAATDALRAQHDEALGKAKSLGARVTELEAELEEKSELMRSMMFARNSQPTSAPRVDGPT